MPPCTREIHPSEGNSPIERKTITKNNTYQHRDHRRRFRDCCCTEQYPKNWLVKLTKKKIPNEVLDIACLGKNFGVPYKSTRIPVEQIIAGIESYINESQTNQAEKIRTKCFEVIKNYLHNNNKTVHDQSLCPKLMKKISTTIKFKRNNPDILFMKADKGNATVIIDKNLYLSKMSKLLNDQSTYHVLNYNPTEFIQSHVNKLVKRWHAKSWITEREKFYLLSKKSSIARAYGLPKIHKENIPLRMIVSFVGTPTYHLARYLQGILLRSLRTQTSVFTNKVTINNSISLVKTIRRLQLPADFVMISMDVVSLFTNVPLKLVLAGITKRWEIIKNHTLLSKDEFLEAITLCFNSSAFQFNNIIYQQVFGAAMGSPLSPIMSEIVMQDLEDFCLKKLDFPVYFYTRYVDDILAFLPANGINQMLTVFNNYQKRLQFTVEIECNCRISFLEVLLIRSSGKIAIDWYQKPTASGRYLNYYSHHPKSQKIGVIYTLLDKACLIADIQFKNKNIAFIRNLLVKNGYPLSLIKNTIYRRVTFLLFDRRNMLDENNNTIVINYHGKLRIFKDIMCLPYVGNLSEILARSLKCLNVDIAFKNCNRLNWLYQGHKDSFSIVEKTDTVYSISCSNCDFVFVDHTKQQLGLSIEKHRRNLKYYYYSHLSTPLIDHTLDTGHKFDFDNVKILATESLYRKRLILTKIYATKFQKSISHSEINKIYHPLFEMKSENL